jgi:TetR/AcrR family transcriptional repressor of nem operon
LNGRSTDQAGTDTRNRLVEAASRLFHVRGYGATGIATVLKAARVNTGSLYHAFDGKDAVLIGVLERHLERLGPTVVDPVEGTADDPIERVFALFALYRRNLSMSGFRDGCPVGNLALEIGDELPEARRLIEQYFGKWTDAVRRWLEAAGDRLPADLDRAGLSRHVLSLLQGALMQARAAGGPEAFDTTVDQLRGHVRLLEERACRERGEEPNAGTGGADDRRQAPRRLEWRSW